MKRFFTVSFALILLALLTTIGVWYTLQRSFFITPEAAIAEPAPPVELQKIPPTIEVVEEEQTAEEVEVLPTVDTDAPETPVKLPITDEQRAVAERLGINPDDITITDAMIACVQDVLSADRLAEIVGGETPSFTEALKLLPCVRAE